MNTNQETNIGSKKVRNLLIGIVGLIVLLLTFQAGMLVGFRRANFSHELGESYYRTFGMEHSMGGFFGLGDENLPTGHGAAGKIVRINLPTFVVAGPDNVEKVVVLSDDTAIRQFRNTVSSSTLALGDYVVVLGEPDQKGEIGAELVRILPPPLGSATGTATTSTSY